MDYVKAAETALRLINKHGRSLSLYKLSGTAADPAKPWRGPGVATRTGQADTKGIFLVPNTSIPTESRGLAYDWVNQDLLARARRVVIVPALGMPDLTDYKLGVDLSETFEIIWGQALQPGDTKLIWVLGLAQ